MRAFKVAPQGRELKSLAISIKQMLVVGGLFSFAFPHTDHLKEIWNRRESELKKIQIIPTNEETYNIIPKAHVLNNLEETYNIIPKEHVLNNLDL